MITGLRPPARLLVAGVVVLAFGAGLALALTRQAPATEPGPADAVLALFAARADGSCPDYVATTTAFFRNDQYLGSPTCADFAAEAAEHDGRSPVRVTVESVVRVDADTAEVEVVERYRAGTAEEYSVVMAYRTQLTDGAWAVDHVDLTVLPD